MDKFKKAKLLKIKSKHRILSHLEGIHKTFIFGEEDDLKNIREYTYGDDIRNINWIITARERKPFVVEREEIKCQNVKVVLFVDQEFLFKNKLERLIEVFSLIGYSVLYQKDRLEVFIVSNGLQKYFKHRNSHLVVDEAVDFLLSMDLKNLKIKPKDSLNFISKGKRSLVILVGDFVFSIDLSPLLHKHKLYLIRIRDKEEEYPDIYRGYQLRSFDEKRKIPYLKKDMIKRYTANLKEIDEKLNSFLTAHRIPNTKIYTEEDPLIKLKKLFS